MPLWEELSMTNIFIYFRRGIALAPMGGAIYDYILMFISDEV